VLAPPRIVTTMRARYTPATLYLVPYLKERRKDGSLTVPVFSPQPTRWVLHCQAGDGPLRWFRDLKYPNRVNAHLWVSREGAIEQYVPLNRWSWAQGAGNGEWMSFESEGKPEDPLTDAQLTELAKWHVWCGAADTVTNSPSGQGIGTHSMGGAAWGGHACPGPIRAAQRKEIIRRAIALRKTTEDDMKLSDQIVSRPGDPTHPFNAATAVRGAYLNPLAILNIVQVMKEELETLRQDVVGLKYDSATTLRRLQEIKDALSQEQKED
jgi:hypothetical protein